MEPSASQTKPARSPMVTGSVVVAAYLLMIAGCEMDGPAAAGEDGGPGGHEAGFPVVAGAPGPATLFEIDLCDTENGTRARIESGDPGALAGPALARFLIRRGQKVPAPVRPGEFLNYYGVGKPPPVGEGPSLGAELRSDPSGEGRLDLQIAIEAAPPPADRPPLHLVLGIDTSTGMEGTPLQRAKQCCVALAASLRQGDVISLAGWDPDRGALLEAHPISGPDDPVLVGHCNALHAGTAAEIRPALEEAFDLALAQAAPESVRRVVLVSSGGFPITPDDARLVAGMAAGEAGPEIRTFTAGVGGEAAPVFEAEGPLALIAAAGGGARFFVDSAAEAARVFGVRLPALLLPAARDPRVEIELPPTLRLVPESPEEHGLPSGPAVTTVLGFGGRIVLRRSLSSCAPELLDREAAFGLVLRAEDPADGQTREVVLATSVSELLAAGAAAPDKGLAVAAWAGALGEVAGLSGAAARERLDRARAAVRAVDGWEGDEDLAEIDALIGLYRELF
jgi:Ca-activated chloride channel family protein